MVYPEIETPAPRRPMDTYTVSTPYGTVTISDGGRKITFELYSDIRQSRHNTALFAYLQQLIKQGVTQYNTDHLNLSGRDKSLSLTRGKAKLDLVYVLKGKTFECELKTNREVGLDLTAQQLTEFAKYCEHLIVLVPRGSMEEMATILHMINLDHRIAVQPYDAVEYED
ncbi:hypothetical protein ES705_29641 [subsurface metagenome]